MSMAAEMGHHDASWRADPGRVSVVTAVARRLFPYLIEATLIPTMLFYVGLLTVGSVWGIMAAASWTYIWTLLITLPAVAYAGAVLLPPIFDVSGAGDTVIATFTLAIAAGASPIEAAVLSNHAAGIVVGKVGTATTNAEELLASFRQ